MKTQQNRSSTDGNRLGGLSTNDEVTVSGQCNETGWYRFEYNGQTAYVSNSYVSDAKIEVAAADSAPAASTESAPAQETASAGTSTASSIPNASDYPVGVWVDMGDWSFKVSSDWQRPEDAYGLGFHLGDGTGKWCWTKDPSIPDAVAKAGVLKKFINANDCNCPDNDLTHGGTKPLWDEANKTYYFP